MCIRDRNKSESEKSVNLEILNHWNSKKIICHKNNAISLKKIGQGIKHRGNYSSQEIKQAIDSYHLVLTGDDYFWTHKWSLWEFLKRDNADKFYPDEFDPERFFQKNKICQSKAEATEERMLKMFSSPTPDISGGEVVLEETEWGEV
jgi:hypothetical protein